MPRGKKARNPDEEETKEKPVEKEETKTRGRRTKKVPEPVVEEAKVVETSSSEISEFLKANAGSQDYAKKLKELLHNSTAPRGLINEAVRTVFEIVESDATKLNWGKSIIELISTESMEPKKRLREAFFFPCPESEKKLVKHLGTAQKTMLICVFALTNDTLANAIRDAKNRGVQIKMIFDDEMMRMPGSDVKKLHDEGYEVRVDLDPKAHMHHKFVIIDESTVITGSYNWTRQASNKNHENVVVFEDEEIAKKYIEEFNKLWENFAGSIEKCLGGAAAGH
ncbi:hypothetical protein SteCoe_2200 [Stentor coeruleus]|uniref:Mitochondrial cardiolipin hydrolase n=1 Tax=Stentor coeruleus TaxID=5963 RepID=A0A1R2CZX0_9CILI|nr:hypothetical protein SteCoe_2200 [Stentor coeruleus]